MRALLVILAAVLSGCAHARPKVDPTLKEGSLESGGRTRTYAWWGPGKHGAPLVLALHGRGGDGKGMERLSGFTAIARREGFTVVFPDGVGDSWHDGRDEGPAAEQGVDDVAFLTALIDDFVARGSDPRRVFVTGMSNGAFMTVTLVCRAADKLAGAVAVAGDLSTKLSKDCAPSRPVPLALIMGTKDPLVPFAGGQVARRNGEILSADASARFFATRFGCEAEPVVEWLPDTAPDDGTRTSRLRWSGCQGGVHVELYAVENGGHTWPSGWQYLPESWIGKTAKDFSASEEAWRFFSAH
jgi:polyhydroxybutyrate depolymerase